MMILTGLPQHIYAFAAILAALLLSFIFFFALPSFIVSRQLSVVIRRLVLQNGKPPEDMDQIFRGRGVLEHLWLEYKDSLHRQADCQSVRLRSTLPAGAVFRPDILVDIPLRTDFFKHLPGLFTGVGIIGTFYGLLIGMKSFVVSNNAVVVRESLTRLLHGVSEAFLISASAITLAMIVTFVEKLSVAHLNERVEKLAQLLDGLFETGAGEEYLARLVKSSESSTVQIADLFKVELKRMLNELHEKQVAAASAASAVLAERIGQSIEAGLKKPLAEIADALKGTQTDSPLKKLLDDLGTEMRSQSGLQQKAFESLQSAVSKMESAANSQHGMIEQIARSNDDAASREVLLHEKLAELIAEMRKLGEARQTDSGIGGKDALIEGVHAAIAQISPAIQEIRTTAGEVSLAFHTGAEKLNLASRDIAEAGRHVSALLENSAAVSGRFSEAADAVAAASMSLGEMFGDYKAERAALAGQVYALQALAEQVKRDASMSGETLDRIEAATAKLASAQQDVDDYLSKISDVIGAAHQSFSEGMSRAVGEANREFHQALSDSVKLLREGIQELESTLDAATSFQLPHAE